MLNPSRLLTRSLLPSFPLVVVKGELFVTSGFPFPLDVLLGDPEELVSSACTLVVNVVVLETEEAAAREGAPVVRDVSVTVLPRESIVVYVLTEAMVTVDGFPEIVVVLPTVIG
jgi:hypothetical protein